MGRVTPGEDSAWNLGANVSTITAAVVNMASMGYAVFTISNVIQKYGDELSKHRPEHEAVQELTKKEEAMVEAYGRVSHWTRLTKFWKVFLVLTTLGMYMSNGAFVLLASQCFLPFALSS